MLARAQPAETFAENDENEDGKLEGDEIPQISTQTRNKMDKDGDGVLTREEWMEEMLSPSGNAPPATEDPEPAEASEEKAAEETVPAETSEKGTAEND